MKKNVKLAAFEYTMITLAVLLLVAGVYFFKFPNNFSFGGVTGIAIVLSAVTPFSAGTVNFVINMALLAVGFFFFGREFGIKTVYVSVLVSVALSGLEKYVPMARPLTGIGFCNCASSPELGNFV